MVPVSLAGQFVGLNIHQIDPRSRANGPGVCYTIWFQGCLFRCSGCFNPLTHTRETQELKPVAQLVSAIRKEEKAGNINAVSISGGEPFLQVSGLFLLVKEIKRLTSLPVLVFSGHTLGEIKCRQESCRVLDFIDVLICSKGGESPGNRDGSDRTSRAVGRENRELVFLTDVYSPSHFVELPDCEIVIDGEGNINVSGFHPVAVHHEAASTPEAHENFLSMGFQGEPPLGAPRAGALGEPPVA